MLTKISPSKIIKDHFSTFKNDETGRKMISDYFLFFLVPSIIAILICVFADPKVIIKNLVDTLITSISIFAALLFNLLLLVFDLVQKINDVDSKEKNLQKREFLRQIYSNISYSIFISIISVILLLLFKSFDNLIWLQNLLCFFSFTFIGNFVLTLIMILKRIHSLFTVEFDL